MFGNKDAQDKLLIYKDGNGKSPRFYFNRHGNFGFYNGSSHPYQLLSEGNVNITGTLKAQNHVFAGNGKSGLFRDGDVGGGCKDGGGEWYQCSGLTDRSGRFDSRSLGYKWP